MSTQLRCPYPEPRRVPWLGDQVVEPDEVVDIPDEFVDNFRAAGWREPSAPVVWPPEVHRPALEPGEPVPDELSPSARHQQRLRDQAAAKKKSTTGQGTTSEGN